MAFLNYEYNMKISYSEPVDKCYFTIKSIPAHDFRQRNISYDISLSPPARYSKSVDSFGNIQIIGNGYKLMKELLESKEEFTAVYSISDSMAIGASKAILESGKRIPEDYSVVGFDGLDMTYYYNPSITTIRQPVEEMARETTKILFDLINKKAKNQHKVFEAELIIRESTSELSR